ncbi:MAG: hypothetical protein L3J49_06105 [Desulfobulbaceae bacterium]|nr:hypothetical protein [Desulfobulbaceae bacterium]
MIGKKLHGTVRIVLAFWVVTGAVFISSLSAVAAQQVVVIPLIKNQASAISPSDVLKMGTASIAPDSTSDVVEVTPQAGNAGQVTVPTGKYLVITSMSVFPVSPGTGIIEMQLIQNSSVTDYWKLSNAEPSHLSFGPGMLIDSGYALTIKNWASSGGNIRVNLYGYLTNK